MWRIVGVLVGLSLPNPPRQSWKQGRPRSCSNRIGSGLACSSRPALPARTEVRAPCALGLLRATAALADRPVEICHPSRSLPLHPYSRSQGLCTSTDSVVASCTLVPPPSSSPAPSLGPDAARTVTPFHKTPTVIFDSHTLGASSFQHSAHGVGRMLPIMAPCCTCQAR